MKSKWLHYETMTKNAQKTQTRGAKINIELTTTVIIRFVNIQNNFEIYTLSLSDNNQAGVIVALTLHLDIQVPFSV